LMTQGTRTAAAPQQRRELALLMLGGAAGAGLVLLATRQRFARVEITPVHPLAVTVTPVSGQDLLPAVAALAVAALASLAAVLATRGVLRRITGVVTAGLGIGIAVAAMGSISAAAVRAAPGQASLSPGSGAGGGTTAGSTTAGNDPGQGTGSLSGFPSHVFITANGWRALIFIGAAIMLAAGVAVILRAGQLPVMSSRYERAARSPRSWQPAEPEQDPGRKRALLRSTSAASMWESLSAGADPTARPDDE
jgi:uncharacterized membrane protein (TIGR02234 family)